MGSQDKPLGSSEKREVRAPIQSQEKVVLPKVLKYRAFPLYSVVSQLVMLFVRICHLMSPSAGTEMLVWNVQTLPGAGALSPKTLDTDGPLVAGRLPEELLGAVAT